MIDPSIHLDALDVKGTSQMIYERRSSGKVGEWATCLMHMQVSCNACWLPVAAVWDHWLRANLRAGKLRIGLHQQQDILGA